MDNKRVPLYERLPEIYRIRDEEQTPPGQLKSYLALVENVFAEIDKNIEALYHDLFIETCENWVIPYIGDLMGVSRLSGDDWTLRADVADTIALRRRKGTLSAIERLTFNLTKWGVHCAEFRENLAWNQHLNHQRPDMGGAPPYSGASITRFTPIRGGTITVRDPAMLSLLGTPFDPFAHMVDVRPPGPKTIRHNLPNLGIFLWRLQDYTVCLGKPQWQPEPETDTETPEAGPFIVRFHIDPLARPLRLFNTFQYHPNREPPLVTELDRTPGPIPTARLTQDSEAGRPEAYLAINTYDPADSNRAAAATQDVGLQLHLPRSHFDGREWPGGNDPMASWIIRGANLCAWERGLLPGIKNREIIIDPEIGRLVIGVNTQEEATALQDYLLVTYTFGAAGPVGAHPTNRLATPAPWDDRDTIAVGQSGDTFVTLTDAIKEALQRDTPTLVEIRDSLTHVLHLSEDGVGLIEEIAGISLSIQQPLFIRAASDERPIIKLRQPLRFRPRHPAAARDATVRLEGLFITRDLSVFPEDSPLIGRAALNRLEIINCTLDPGGHRILGSPAGLLAPVAIAMQLREPYGFQEAADENCFDQTPEIILQRTITGPLRIDRGYRLILAESIIDAGGTDTDHYAVAGADNPAVAASGELTEGWGPPTEVSGITVLGPMRVEKIHGRGGIWAGTLQVLNNQVGCLKFSYFKNQGDRLPRRYAYVKGSEARLRFVSEIFGEPGYGQLTLCSDFRIRERGPLDDAMGAYGFLMDAHKWRNLQIRFREFMPLGVRPLLIPVT
ncbi:MAG: phage tail protein [Proteobacteria bacterium]|nr:phage tail protein [Pseudomonadota bacterium]